MNKSALIFSLPNDKLKTTLPAVIGFNQYEPAVINLSRWICLFPEQKVLMFKINVTPSILKCEIFGVKISGEALLHQETIEGVANKRAANLMLVRTKIGDNRYQLKEKYE